MADETFKECSLCKKDMSCLDEHDECYRHRSCTISIPCKTCILWTKEKRTAVFRMIDKHKKNKKSTGDLRKTTGVRLGHSYDLEGQSQSQIPHTATSVSTSENSTSTVPSHSNDQMDPKPSNAGVPEVNTHNVDDVQGNFTVPQWMMCNIQDLIDRKVSEALKAGPIQQPPVVAYTREQDDSPFKGARCEKFDRFSRNRSDSEDSFDNGKDVICLTEPTDEFDENDSHSVSAPDHSSFSDSALTKISWKDFVFKFASDLNIPMEEKNIHSEYKSYVSDHLLTPKESKLVRLPLEGSIIQVLEQVDKEWQDKGRIRCFRSSDDQRYLVNEDHFKKFCSSPQLDENIEEGMMNSSDFQGRKGSMPYKFNNRSFDSINSEFRRLDMSSRLLLRQVSYGSLITTYLDKAVSDEDKQEAVHALSQLFNSMADVTSRVILNTVSARRGLYLKDMAFKNKATENKLLRQSAIGSKLFGEKFFEVLHSSAENLRDAKETQYLRDNRRKDYKRKAM